ncbi:glycosyltransferase family 2 protein [Diaminobutyricibacter tongyongensis]|uniref:Glycosyltransferase family 2 protein n=1 Tax=Leifsonia tongyongensis TaxID=1268043 RepID=A0A6L9Y185_9MICO|nr:glycosyltransferase family 2 protein [Diaminobutyricibacter tongyongensis]NEN07034.1 glycosyltransferase family 2 protein [Diaminobutyricibacter tongyongensis]
MYPRVTAVIVARNGGDHLQRTLDALAAQTRQPDVIVAVDCASTDDAAQLLAASAPTHLVSLQEKLPFGAAVATGLRVTPPASSEHDWLWLLAQDTAPEPGALEALLGAVEVSPSVAAAGPKLVEWDDRNTIREYGEAMTQFGTAVNLVENELDQAQHDGLSDVLAVSPAGLIVRQSVWDELGGFDPALPVVDDGLDFCVRVRLAGFRVVLVPSARIAIAGDGVAGPNSSRKGRVRRRLIRARRAAQLHRRMVYAPAAAVPIHWLSLVPLAFFRSIGRIVGKEPGAITGEFAAAFRTAFAGIRVSSARRNLARHRVVGWAAIAPLRIPIAEVRRARALKREAAYVTLQGERRDLNFFGGGGAWVVLAAAVLGIALFFPLLGSDALAGGALLPMPSSVGDLWNTLGYGWRDVGLGFVGAADPFAAVLAVFGTLTFWQPSLFLVVLYFAALPLAALGAWMLASRLTQRSSLRAFAALAWAIAPPLLIAMQTGRPAAILAHLLLPWLFFAGLSAARSWAAAGTTALLAAATVACAPSLIPALLVIWVIALVLSRRRFARLIVVLIPSAVLFAPLVWQQALRGAWVSVFADPGVVTESRPVPAWQLALGFPDGMLGGWHAVATALHISGVAPNVVVAVLLAPLAILALLSLFLRGSSRAVLALVVALLGFATAVAATLVSVSVSASVAVLIWPGTGVSLYWLGLVCAAIIGLGAVGRFAALPAFAALATIAIAATPAAIAMPLGVSSVRASDGRTLPAVVTANASSAPRTGTLRLTAQPDGGIGAEVLRGSGATLSGQSTLSSTDRTLSDEERSLATLAGNLSSKSGFDPTQQLKSLGIDYILLAPPVTALGADATPAAKATALRATVALDADAALVPVGPTATGALWSFERGTTDAPPAAQVPPDAGAPWRTIVLAVQAVVIGLILLLSIPTRRTYESLAAESVRRPKGTKKPGGAPAAESDGESEPDSGDEAEDDDDVVDSGSALDADLADDDEPLAWPDEREELSAYDPVDEWDHREPAVARGNGGDSAD